MIGSLRNKPCLLDSVAADAAVRARQAVKKGMKPVAHPAATAPVMAKAAKAAQVKQAVRANKVRAVHKAVALAVPVTRAVTARKVPAVAVVAAVSVAVRAAEAVRIQSRQIFRTAAMTTSSHGSFAKLRCRKRIPSCARNSGRSTGITRRARVNRSAEWNGIVRFGYECNRDASA